MIKPNWLRFLLAILGINAGIAVIVMAFSLSPQYTLFIAVLILQGFFSIVLMVIGIIDMLGNV